MYGFFLGYLNVDAYAYAAATTVVALPWSFKFVFGAINDVCPINGERRRPYIALGWAFCAVALWFLAMMPLPTPTGASTINQDGTSPPQGIGTTA